MDHKKLGQIGVLLAMTVGFCWAIWPWWTTPIDPPKPIGALIWMVIGFYPWLLARPVRLAAAAPFLLWVVWTLIVWPLVAGPVVGGASGDA